MCIRQRRRSGHSSSSHGGAAMAGSAAHSRQQALERRQYRRVQDAAQHLQHLQRIDDGLRTPICLPSACKSTPSVLCLQATAGYITHLGICGWRRVEAVSICPLQQCC